MDWLDWHAAYDDPASKQAHRLAVIQDRIRDFLDDLRPGPFTAVSMCAGQGRDLLGVLADHPRRGDIRARLVERDPRNAAIARANADPVTVEVAEGDAGLTAAYAGLVPADLVLAVGVLGNLVPADVENTVDACAAFCRPGGAVIWTRHRKDPDPVPAICDRFEQYGFERLYLTDPALGFTVGVHRPTRPPAAFDRERIFTFAGYQATGA